MTAGPPSGPLQSRQLPIKTQIAMTQQQLKESQASKETEDSDKEVMHWN